MLAQLQQDGQIAGSYLMTPPDKAGLAADWFRSCLADWRGPLLSEHERLRDLLPRGNKPYVIVLDQMENQVTDEALRVFTKTLAEDSVFTKSYVVILVTTNPMQANIMNEWNGRQQLALIGGNPYEIQMGRGGCPANGLLDIGSNTRKKSTMKCTGARFREPLCMLALQDLWRMVFQESRIQRRSKPAASFTAGCGS